MNPCPCGFSGVADSRCRCTAEQIQRYRDRISGPLLDRIDIQVEVPRPERPILYAECGVTEGSSTVRGRVEQAYALQRERQGVPNAQLDIDGIRTWCRLDGARRQLLEHAAERFEFSPRANHRVLKVARTIADLEGHEEIGEQDLAEAIGYRLHDRASRCPGTNSAGPGDTERLTRDHPLTHRQSAGKR